ncbi:MAG TPA: NADH-ubiquinone oxidoreductase-F iron-sulfur binding region domain-containing protein [Acidimicrobiales bacterium]|nr:NADH-ubiquinone oxidoreductase-F iron-sulfur binding region domain-containing protein [Acidimicrobiales bacterium]
MRRTAPGGADAGVAPPAGPARLLAGLDDRGGTRGLAQHLEQWGPLRTLDARNLLADLEASGLRGHGGAWFPVAAKWRSVAEAGYRRPVVVANAAEGEPASAKDALLTTRVPHLVLDGASLAARALRARRLVVYCRPELVTTVARAADERHRAGIDSLAVEVVAAPGTFLAGQETAVASALNGRQPLPTFAGIHPVRELGVEGRPTLVQNVETLAHVALVARFGPHWFRGAGTEGSPGTMLLTVTGRWEGPTVVEAPLGTPLAEVLDLDGRAADRYWGVLLGGYGGGWVGVDEALGMPLTEEAARGLGSSLGAGVVALLPSTTCPLHEVARVARYLEAEGAGQCGPCVNGLAELSGALSSLAGSGHQRPAPSPRRARGGDPVARVLELCRLVEGRGACRHPDGAARFVRTALRVFEGHLAAHRRPGPCGAGPDSRLLPVPAPPAAVRRTGAR